MKNFVTLSEREKESRKIMAKFIRQLPKFLNIRQEKFIEGLAEELGKKYSTIETYLKKGFSKEFSSDTIHQAVQNVCNRYASVESFSAEEKEKRKLAYEEASTLVFDAIATMEHFFRDLKPFAPYLTEEHQKYRVASAFMMKIWPGEGKCLTAEETNLLRESLRQHPPKGIKF